MVLLKELPDVIKQSGAAYVDCLSGAIMKDADRNDQSYRLFLSLFAATVTTGAVRRVE
ncbi:MAG: hypothetical protein WCE82_03585 [Halobacteriota archaeon]